ncbi:MAG TPA: hypothetical protein VKB46_24485 [Pyrinomonadaceae bacterium]|nr:hypothetical protein [Pyrinomonadaceae bacterium]
MSFKTKRSFSLLRRFLLLLTSLFCLVSAVQAFTIVMRDGRRVEIPDQFSVGEATLTYEVSPGIQVTVQLAAIDIAATERENKEPAGSFRARVLKSAPEFPAQNVPATRSITNIDLESYRLAREKSESAYEQKRKSLGLPSKAEVRKETAGRTNSAQETARNVLNQRQETEGYWRDRADALRTEFVANDARISYVRRRLEELPLASSFGTFTTLSPFITVDQLAIRPTLSQPLTTVSTAVGPLNRGNMIFGGPRRGVRLGMNPPRFPGVRTRPFRPVSSFGPLVALPFDALDYSYERTTLVTELNSLLSHRAELQARWRALEDDARRAGAYPGWLRR